MKKGFGVVLVAIQGAGKTTAMKVIQEEWPTLTVCSAGGAIADIRNGKLPSKLSLERALVTVQGNLLADEEISLILDETLARYPECQNFGLDGYVRSVGQLDALLERFCRVCLIFLDASQENSLKRILGRKQEEMRPDDTPEAVSWRHEQFFKVTMPAVTYARERADKVRLCYYHIDGNGTIPQVSGALRLIVKLLKYQEDRAGEMRECSGFCS